MKRNNHKSVYLNKYNACVYVSVINKRNFFYNTINSWFREQKVKSDSQAELNIRNSSVVKTNTSYWLLELVFIVIRL